MHFEIPHTFTKADAHARTQYLFDYWKSAYGVQSHWQGDHAFIAGRVMGVEIIAELVVDEQQIRGGGEDPGPFLRALARNYITQKLRKYMHPEYREP